MFSVKKSVLNPHKSLSNKTELIVPTPISANSKISELGSSSKYI